mgnify:CR=1 FL=1
MDPSPVISGMAQVAAQSAVNRKVESSGLSLGDSFCHFFFLLPGHEQLCTRKKKNNKLPSGVTPVSSVKIGTIQRRLAWPLRKDDTQNREAFHIFVSA